MKFKTKHLDTAALRHNEHVANELAKEASEFIKSIIKAYPLNTTEMSCICYVVDTYRAELDKFTVK